jgi:hypothetical protein
MASGSSPIVHLGEVTRAVARAPRGSLAPAPRARAPLAAGAAIAPLALLVTALAVLAPRPSRADALNFSWDQCWPEGGTAFQSWACNSSTGTRFVMIGSLVTSKPMPAGLHGVEFRVDVSLNSATLPDWWRFGVGECREHSLGFSADFSVFNVATCIDPWQAQAGVTFSSYDVPSPRLGGSHSAQIHGLVELSTGSAVPLAAGNEYRLFWLRLYPFKTTGPISCGGCNIPATLELLSAKLFEGPNGDASELVTDTASNRCIRWQGSAGDLCSIVPARNRTWGAIKSIYR